MLLLGSLILLNAAIPHPAASPAPAKVETVTFFVASDSHFGYRNMDEVNRGLVEQMNGLPGTPYPPSMGGVVETPRGVLFLGDMTDNGHLDEFAQFEAVFGLTGRDGLLRFPLFEAIGNHDVNQTSPIKPKVVARHGAINYSFDWDGLHFACLDMFPDDKTLAWLDADLAKVKKETPVLLFFHYSLAGPYSDFWEDAEKAAFAKAIARRNVAAIFHGHEHRVGHYLWEGHPVFRPGAAKHSSHFFLAVRVGAKTLDVASWDYDKRAWGEAWSVPVRR
jgi:cytolysin (calcineurin-like family phosphatase)